MQRTSNDLIRNVRSIEIAGVDVIHTGSDCCAQHGDSGLRIARRSEHAGTRELHRTVPHPVHGH